MKFEDKLIRRLDTVYQRTFNLPRKDSAEDVFHSITQVQEEGVAIVDYMRLSYIFDNPKNFKKFVRALGYNFIPQGIEYVGEDGLEDYLIIQLMEEFDPSDATEEGVELYEEAIDKNIIYVDALQDQVITASDQTEREFFDELLEGRYNLDLEYELPDEDPGRDLLDTYWEFSDSFPPDLENIVDTLEELAPQLKLVEKLEEIYDENGIELDSDTLNKIRKLVIHGDTTYSNQGIELARSLGGISNEVLRKEVLTYIRPLRERVEELKESEREVAQDTFDNLVDYYRHHIEHDWNDAWHWQTKDELEGYWGMLDHETNLQEIAESDFYQEQWKERSSFSYNKVLDAYQRAVQLYSSSPNQLQLFGA